MIEPRYIGFWPRFAAGVIDLALAFAVARIIAGIALLAGADRAWLQFIDHAMLDWLLLLFLLGFCWHRFGGTPGLMLIGAQVVSAKAGRPITLKAAMIRSFGLVPSYALMGLGVLWMGWDKQKQGWHDKFAGTVVVPEGILLPDDESEKSLQQLLAELR